MRWKPSDPNVIRKVLGGQSTRAEFFGGRICAAIDLKADGFNLSHVGVKKIIEAVTDRALWRHESGEIMAIQMTKDNIKKFQLIGAIAAFILFAGFRLITSYDYFSSRSDFNVFEWVAASALVWPVIMAVGFYFILGRVYKKQLNKNTKDQS